MPGQPLGFVAVLADKDPAGVGSGRAQRAGCARGEPFEDLDGLDGERAEKGALGLASTMTAQVNWGGAGVDGAEVIGDL